MKTIAAIILTYKPDRRLLELIRRLSRQSVLPDRLIMVNTRSDVGKDILAEAADLAASAFPETAFPEVDKADFDHGGTRDMAARMCGTDLAMFMTMDALPADRYLVERLAAAFEDEDTACAYARQIPAQDATPEEGYGRLKSYPDVSRKKTAADILQLGIRTFFCSDVCAMYRMKTYLSLGGFVHPAIFNEDMIFAAKAVKAGMSVWYRADAKVIHSHNYTGRMQFHRNFDLGVSQADHPEVFAAVSSEKEGASLVRETAAYLFRKGKAWRIPLFIYRCVCRYAGYLMGKHYRMLPRALILRFTMNPEYWKKQLDE